MVRNFLFPLEETPGDAGGGGGSPAPEASAGTGGAPAPVTLSDDSLFIPPGGKEPVKYKDFLSGYVPKSDLTRMRQQDSVALQQREAALRAEETRLKTAAQQLAQRLNPQTGQPTPDPFAEIEAAPYLDGKTAAQIMRQLVSGIQARNQQLEQAYGLLHQRLQRAEQGFSTLQGRTQKADVENLFIQARSKLGLPDNPAVAELLSDVYHAHEGWETVTPDERVEQLSQLAKTRYDALQTLFKTTQQQKVEAARTARLAAPAVKPALRPMPKGVGGESPEALANKLWPLVAGTADT